jgi:hypothetical protein
LKLPGAGKFFRFRIARVLIVIGMAADFVRTAAYRKAGALAIEHAWMPGTRRGDSVWWPG